MLMNGETIFDCRAAIQRTTTLPCCWVCQPMTYCSYSARTSGTRHCLFCCTSPHTLSCFCTDTSSMPTSRSSLGLCLRSSSGLYFSRPIAQDLQTFSELNFFFGELQCDVATHAYAKVFLLILTFPFIIIFFANLHKTAGFKLCMKQGMTATASDQSQRCRGR